jgi:Protein of unknown function (DUF3106)
LQAFKTITVIAVLLLGATVASAQRGRRNPPPPPPPPPQRQGPPQGQAPFGTPGAQPPRRGPVFHGPGPHFGDWLRNHEKQSPADRLKALEQDPGFQNLPPDVKDRMRNRLQDFNNRPSEQQQQILQRMETFEHLSPDQQQKVRGMFRDFRNLPPERRRALNQGLRFLQDMPADQRQKAVDSDVFRSRFSDQERDLLRGMSAVGINPGAPPPNPPNPPR